MLKSNSTPVRAVAMWNGLLMRFPALISFFLLCCGLASGCWEDVTTQVAATVLSVKGTVVFGMAEQNNFQPVTRESRIHDGDRARTSDAAVLRTGLIPAALAQLPSQCEV